MNNGERSESREQSTTEHTVYERLGRFVVGASAGAAGAAIGIFILYKFGYHLETPVETAIIATPAVIAGVRHSIIEV